MAAIPISNGKDLSERCFDSAWLSTLFAVLFSGCCWIHASNYLPVEAVSADAGTTPALLSTAVYGDVGIAFARFAIDQSPWFDQIQKYGIQLRINGIHGISKKEAFVFGSLSVPGGAVRSFILRTSDHGRSWQEVLDPEPLSTASEVFFLNGGIGWAVILRTPEGVESANLYKTIDHGKSWQLVGPLPNHGQGSYQTLGLRFADIDHGEIWAETIEVIDNKSDLYKYCLCKTMDGGVTWEWTTMCCDAEKADFSWVVPVISNAGDGAQWRYETSESSGAPTWSIYQRNTRPSKWKTVAVIPKRYKNDNGHMFPVNKNETRK